MESASQLPAIRHQPIPFREKLQSLGNMAERLSCISVPLSEHIGAAEVPEKQTCTAGKIAVEEAIVSEELLGKHVTYAVRVSTNAGI